MKTYTPITGMIVCANDTGDYVEKPDYDRLRKALSAALDVLDTNADDEGVFWGEDSPFAEEAREIYDNARAALGIVAPSNNPHQP